MVNLTIDNCAVQVPEGTTILNAAKTVGISDIKSNKAKKQSRTFFMRQTHLYLSYTPIVIRIGEFVNA